MKRTRVATMGRGNLRPGCAHALIEAPPDQLGAPGAVVPHRR